MSRGNVFLDGQRRGIVCIVGVSYIIQKEEDENVFVNGVVVVYE